MVQRWLLPKVQAEEDPWLIENAEQLAYLAQQVNEWHGLSMEAFFGWFLTLTLAVGVDADRFYWAGRALMAADYNNRNDNYRKGKQLCGSVWRVLNFTAASSYIKSVTVKRANISGNKLCGRNCWGEGANISDCYSIENTIYAIRWVGGVCGSLTRKYSGCYNSSSVMEIMQRRNHGQCQL